MLIEEQNSRWNLINIFRHMKMFRYSNETWIYNIPTINKSEIVRILLHTFFTFDLYMEALSDNDPVLRHFFLQK